MQASTPRPPVSRPRRLRKRVQQPRPAPDVDGAEPIKEPELQPSHAAREESLETDVAPDLLDREPVTGDDLH